MRCVGAILAILAVLSLLPPAFAQAAPQPGDDAALIRRLIDSLKDSDQEVRQNIAVALAKLGTPAVEPLIAALKDTVPERRAGAAYALALMGSTARAAMPNLLDALNDKELEVRRQVSYAISRIVRPAPRPAAAPGGGFQ